MAFRHNFLAFGILGLVACVGDTALNNNIVVMTGNDAAVGADTSTSNADSAIAMMDAPLVCSGTTTSCHQTCVDLGAAKTDCGRCGHDCGGGDCAQGICQPSLIRSGLTNPVFDIDGTNVYFADASTIYSCPLAGCGSLKGTQIGAFAASVDDSQGGGVLLAGGGNVFFMIEATGSNTSGPFLDQCPISGCAPTPPVMQGSNHQGFTGGYAISGSNTYYGWYKNIGHASCTASVCTTETLLAGTSSGPSLLATDGAGVYFALPTTPTVLQRCLSAGTCTPETIGTVGAFDHMRAAAGIIYLLASGGDGYTNGNIRTCPTTSTTCTGTTFIGAQPFPLDFTVDSASVSWLNRDALGNSPASSIYTCPVAGCQGGPQPIALGQTGANQLRSDAKFVYWATGNSIWLVAK